MILTKSYYGTEQALKSESILYKADTSTWYAHELFCYQYVHNMKTYQLRFLSYPIF